MQLLVLEQLGVDVNDMQPKNIYSSYMQLLVLEQLGVAVKDMQPRNIFS